MGAKEKEEAVLFLEIKKEREKELVGREQEVRERERRNMFIV